MTTHTISLRRELREACYDQREAFRSYFGTKITLPAREIDAIKLAQRFSDVFLWGWAIAKLLSPRRQIAAHNQVVRQVREFGGCAFCPDATRNKFRAAAFASQYWRQVNRKPING